MLTSNGRKKTEHLANYWLMATQKNKKAWIATIINHCNKKNANLEPEGKA